MVCKEMRKEILCGAVGQDPDSPRQARHSAAMPRQAMPRQAGQQSQRRREDAPGNNGHCGREIYRPYKP